MNSRATNVVYLAIKMKIRVKTYNIVVQCVVVQNSWKVYNKQCHLLSDTNLTSQKLDPVQRIWSWEAWRRWTPALKARYAWMKHEYLVMILGNKFEIVCLCYWFSKCRFSSKAIARIVVDTTMSMRMHIKTCQYHELIINTLSNRWGANWVHHKKTKSN